MVESECIINYTLIFDEWIHGLLYHLSTEILISSCTSV